MRKSTKTSFLSAVLCYNETNIKGFHEVQSQEVVIMTRGIRVKNTDDIQKINKIVTRYGFDIWIHGKSGMVDAKSLLGMFLLGAAVIAIGLFISSLTNSQAVAAIGTCCLHAHHPLYHKAG